MTILGLLSSMVLFALASAQESARVAKTQSTINKLNALIMAKYDSYRTRRVPADTVASRVRHPGITHAGLVSGRGVATSGRRPGRRDAGAASTPPRSPA